jgi:exodeoxyribonuclease VII large subunit
MVDAVARAMDELVGAHDDALSIAGLYDEVQGAIERVFPRRRALWVRGEIQHVSDPKSGRGHCYMDLVDPESARERQAPVLKVKCWQSTWGPLRAMLTREGIQLAPGMVVTLRGSLDFYRPKAEIGFVVAELDVTALLGRLAAQRAALLRALEGEGLLRRNGEVRVPEVPLRIGLVASPGTEGYRDFVGQLAASGFAFDVKVVPVTVQGPSAPAALSSAVRRLSAIGPGALDLVVIVRGGGSKADLAAFDAQPVARAVATSTLPVWTGIGHTGDESVTDIVANRACITPTECGRELVQRVQAWWDASVVTCGTLVARRAAETLAAAQRGHDATRTRLAAMARHLIDRQCEQVSQRAMAIARCAPRVVDDARERVGTRATRLEPLVTAKLDQAAAALDSWRRLVAAYDVERQLERGYTLTLDAAGHVVRQAAQLATGDEVTTRFADGAVRSVVAGLVVDDGPGPTARDKRDKTRAEV